MLHLARFYKYDSRIFLKSSKIQQKNPRNFQPERSEVQLWGIPDMMRQSTGSDNKDINLVME